MHDETCNVRLYTDTKLFPGGEVLWDLIPPNVFRYALQCGLTEDCRLLDVGCGPLRIGRHLITFLRPGLYTGLEPEQEMVERGMKEPPLTEELLAYKRPRFVFNGDFEVDGEFDFVLANQVFFHCGRAQLTKFLCNMLPLVRGPILMTVFIRSFDASINKSLNPEHFNYRFASHGTVNYTREAFASLATQCGYVPTELGGTFLEYETFWRLDKAGTPSSVSV